MKKIFISIPVLAGLFFYIACSPKKPAVFEQKSGIYFGATTDSLLYSFAKYPKRMTDTLHIPVKMLGDAPSTDKTFNIETVNVTGKAAVAGVHFKLLNPYTMPAGQLATTIPVVVYRTPDMDTTVFSFKLQLQANEDFETGMTTKSTYLVNVAYLQKPANWGTSTGLVWWAGNKSNFGTWTRTKYKLILDALYDPEHDTTVTEFPFGTGTNALPIGALYLQTVKNYIRINYPANYGGTGNILTDPDASNLPVQVGAANY